MTDMMGVQSAANTKCSLTLTHGALLGGAVSDVIITCHNVILTLLVSDNVIMVKLGLILLCSTELLNTSLGIIQRKWDKKNFVI